ncbi:membrane protein [Citromicrobium sp. RCC1885]|uniref:DUF979 domain-containing protein n=1 Tax=unclassified Citromicrobium TaxID=2630544 RepID=UPI0006C938BC|nr:MULTISPECIES: DUF979 domain-containing protein [unclassified Citromicrobium]KPM22455.1 membrane protein [Citromicrobium sp. RCC1885]KPM25938.1 membrane protein [Citromicrobium sp. RCC1878]MAO03179.1 DUF979 domain-containing protein [Citromicrobium sp.]OAM07986.1 hypothetical protein A0U43_12245 [Citromicrobium sp. RCC1897]|tara:strand:- start:2546 stop:3508 length:963 start_codon:yes stop_codon:yes gene_type:complete
MITYEWLYVLSGIFFAIWAVLSALDRSNGKRWGNAAFWGLLAVSFLLGSHLTPLGNGLLVLALVAIAGVGGLGRSDPPTTTLEERLKLAELKGNRLFVPALIVPFVAVVGTLAYNYTPLSGTGLFEPRRETLLLFAIGVLVALAVAMAWLKPPALAAAQEGRRLLDSIGWAAILPQMLAALGAVFAVSGVGDIIGSLAGQVIPEGSVLLTVIVFCLGMAIFTMIMGNAFAAFPVMAAAIGIPLLVEGYGGNPAVIGAVGMLAGFCGTLLTPMAANFNIVPAALLELDDQNGVIKQQVWTAIPLWVCNIAIIYIGGFLLWT